jgi:hypothetical protein
MSYHIKKPNYTCKKCSGFYIPFNKDIVCPNCGHPADTENYFDYIDNVASSMKAHKFQYGSFMPPAFYCDGSLAANIQSNCLNIFDLLEVVKPKDEKTWLSNVVTERFEFSDEDKYLAKHITDAVLSLYGLYQKQNKFAASKFKMWLVRKLKDYLP